MKYLVVYFGCLRIQAFALSSFGIQTQAWHAEQTGPALLGQSLKTARTPWA